MTARRTRGMDQVGGEGQHHGATPRPMRGAPAGAARTNGTPAACRRLPDGCWQAGPFLLH